MYTPTPENEPGRASEATRTPFGRVDMLSSSVGSLRTLVTADEETGGPCEAQHTFGGGTLTYAKLRAEIRAGEAFASEDGALNEEAMLPFRSLTELARNMVPAECDLFQPGTNGDTTSRGKGVLLEQD